jgi:hypothetical protein
VLATRLPHRHLGKPSAALTSGGIRSSRTGFAAACPCKRAGRGDSAVIWPKAAVSSVRRHCGRAVRLQRSRAAQLAHKPPCHRLFQAYGSRKCLWNGTFCRVTPERSRGYLDDPSRAPATAARIGRDFFCTTGGAPCKAMLIAALQCATFRQMHWSVPEGGHAVRNSRGGCRLRQTAKLHGRTQRDL